MPVATNNKHSNTYELSCLKSLFYTMILSACFIVLFENHTCHHSFCWICFALELSALIIRIGGFVATYKLYVSVPMYGIDLIDMLFAIINQIYIERKKIVVQINLPFIMPFIQYETLLQRKVKLSI